MLISDRIFIEAVIYVGTRNPAVNKEFISTGYQYRYGNFLSSVEGSSSDFKDENEKFIFFSYNLPVPAGALSSVLKI